jgi:hypothetical protein
MLVAGPIGMVDLYQIIVPGFGVRSVAMEVEDIIRRER